MFPMSRSRPVGRIAALAMIGAGAILAGTAGVPASAAAAPACVDFLPVPDNTHPGALFTRSGYQFRSPPGTDPIVNVFVDLAGAPVHGLQFNGTGVRVRLPAPADTVTVVVGVFTAPAVTIRAYDAAGAVVDVT